MNRHNGHVDEAPADGSHEQVVSLTGIESYSAVRPAQTFGSIAPGVIVTDIRNRVIDDARPRSRHSLRERATEVPF